MPLLYAPLIRVPTMASVGSLPFDAREYEYAPSKHGEDVGTSTTFDGDFNEHDKGAAMNFIVS